MQSRHGTAILKKAKKRPPAGAAFLSGDGVMRFQIQGTVATADLHGVYQQDAKDLLSGWLNTAPAAVTELRVIHGYQRGTALRDMLRSGFSHPRVKAVLPSLNPGETRLVLKK